MKIPGNTLNNAGVPLNNQAGVVAHSAAVSDGKAAAGEARAAPTQTAHQARVPVDAGANLLQLFSQLKLPQDNLSKSLVAFARFFSLPLEPKVMNGLRRDALSSGGKDAHSVLPREAAALGAAAAADKGLRLGEKALAEYAAAIEGSLASFAEKEPEAAARESREPDRREPQDRPEDGHTEQDGGSGGGDGGRGREQGGWRGQRGNQNGAGQEADGGHGERGGFGNGAPPDGEAPLSAEDLRLKASEILKDRPPLDFINRVPGKKGRWITLPFSFSRGGLEFSVSLRIFTAAGVSGTADLSGAPLERLTADITVTRAGGQPAAGGAAMDSPAAELPENARRWYISLERSASASDATAGRAVLFCGAEDLSLAGKKRLAKELAEILGLPPENVSFVEKPPLFADSRIDHLLSVDEEV